VNEPWTVEVTSSTVPAVLHLAESWQHENTEADDVTAALVGLLAAELDHAYRMMRAAQELADRTAQKVKEARERSEAES
jgi:hypothetical protein